MRTSPAYPLRIFFDGSCSVCAARMAAYRRKAHGGRLEFVDAGAAEFDPLPYGITREAFLYELHAIDGDNHVYRGVDAFRAIWLALPASTLYGVLGMLVAVPGVHSLARMVYWSFARIRRFLPGRADVCRDGGCRLGTGGFYR